MATDQEIRDRGIKFLPRQEFLQSPYQFNEPVVEEEEVTESFGIPNTTAFTNSGGNNFSGSTYNLGGQFQRAVDARQASLNDTSLNKKFLGFPSYRQGVTGADAGEYVGNNMDIPTQETFMGKVQNYLEPQSAQSILEDGYRESRFQPGIIGMIMGKFDNYRNLPRADQAFIAQNMGYTGPTIFGENNSGLGKDLFGINTRSAKGNYGEYVDKKSGQLTDTLTKQGGKIFDKYAVDPITGQALDEEEFSYDPITGQYIGTNAAAIAKANKMNKMNLTQLGFYKNKQKEFKEIQKQTLEQQMRDDKIYGGKGKSDPQDKSRAGSLGRRPGSGGNVTATSANTNKESGTTYDSGGREGFGYGLKKGGRAGYFFGGRVNFKNGGLASIL